MLNYQKHIVYLSDEQRQELFTNGSITVNGQTVIYSDNDMYVTPQEVPYVKPANGIPASDLDPSALNSKADKNNTTITGSLSMYRKANTTIGTASTAIGANNTASGIYSTAFGNTTTALGTSSFAIGTNTEASGNNSVAEGNYANADGRAAHAAGEYTRANGRANFVRGRANVLNTTSIFPEWAAETEYTQYDRVKVTTESNGETTVTLYMCTTNHTSTSTFDSSKWEDVTDYKDFADIVGNGRNGTDRSNAYALDWNGNAYFKGNVYAGCDDDSTGGSVLPRVDDTAGSGNTDKIWSADKSNSEVAALDHRVDAVEIYETVSTLASVMTIADGANDIPVDELVVGIEPVQSGSGDPAPDNVRPISGWTGVNVSHSGADTTNPETISVTLPSSAGTVYGGTLTIRKDGTGTLVVDHAVVNMKTADNSSFLVSKTPDSESNNIIRFTGCTNREYGSGTGHAFLSAEYKWVGNGSTSGLYGTLQDGECGGQTTTTYIVFREDRIANDTLYPTNSDKIIAFKTMLADGTICYPLSTPSDPIQLTVPQVKTLLGANNFWANTGNIKSITYSADPKLYIEQHCVSDVQVNGTSILSQGVANVPIAVANGDYGLVKIGNSGVSIDSNGALRTIPASDSTIQGGTVNYNVIAPLKQHISAFYGLAKAAGADMASSSNPVGTYTDAAKVAIQKMLGIYQAPWELLDTITLTEEGRIDISYDGNGNPLNAIAAFIRVTYPNGTAAASTGYGRYYFKDENDVELITETGKNTAITSQSTKVMLAQKYGNMGIVNLAKVGSDAGSIAWAVKAQTGIKFEFGNIRRIYMNANDVEPAGVTIQVYIRPAY